MQPESPESPEPSLPRSWLLNAGACLEPLETTYGLGDHFAEVQRTLNLDSDALLSLVTAPAFRHPHALSLHRRPAGFYVLRVTRVTSDEMSPRVRERTIDSTTAKLLQKLLAALAARVQMVEADTGSLDGKAYYFSSGRVTGYAANPRGGSVLDHTIFAMDWLTRLVEEPNREDPMDRHFIREELQEALARTVAMEPCGRGVTE